VAAVVQLVQVVQILALLVVLVAAAREILLPADQHQEHHSQELLEQPQHLVGDILVGQELLPVKLVEVEVALVELEHKVQLLLLVVLVFKSHQHLEILHS
jgi:hypothetical protein